MVVEPDVDEPTWEVRHPHAGRRRLDGRTRSILTVAAAAAIVVNAGAAWAYWSITGSDTGRDSGGSAVELALRGRSDLNRPLTPGGTGNLTVTVTNDNDFPIRITSVTPGVGNIVADDEHRDKGCTGQVARITQKRFDVSWEVERNTIGAFTIPDGLIMQGGASPGCNGATFTVPVQASGVRRSR
jgi:hypothetical protein